MSEDVCIQYELGQNGWSKFRLSVGAASVTVGPFGYCTDSLGDLVRAALMIATSGSRSEVSFDAEPMEWHLIAGPQSIEADSSVRVLTFPALYPPSPESEGNLLFDARCSADSFVHAVLGVAQAIWDEHGAEGYDKAWRGPCGFPLRALQALKMAVSVEEPPTQFGWQVSSA